jgi:hypothetical protein
LSLFRILGGTLSSDRKPDFRNERIDAVRYDLEITLKLKGMSATDLNDAIATINRLTTPTSGGLLESFHINVDTYVGSAKESSAIAA